jgi:UDP-arabinose 4-epimerase
MRDHGIDKLIFSSTCATYGLPERIPITEDHPQKPINPYGTSKLMIEQILRDFDSAYGMRSISLRYFNAAGADPLSEIGESHEPETHLIPLILDGAAGICPAITIFGNDYDTSDGTCIRDYIHVSDLADAHILALRSLEDGAQTTAYNLGNGKGFSIKEVIQVAQKITNLPIAVRVSNRRKGDPSKLIGDATRIQLNLGWEPLYSNLDDIIRTAWDWHKKYKKIL